jgi:hypothetical protein
MMPGLRPTYKHSKTFRAPARHFTLVTANPGPCSGWPLVDSPEGHDASATGRGDLFDNENKEKSDGQDSVG